MIDTILFSRNIFLYFLRSICVICVFIIFTIKTWKWSSSIWNIICECSWITCKINVERLRTTNTSNRKCIIVCRTGNSRSIFRTSYSFNFNNRSNRQIVWNFGLVICTGSIPSCTSNKSKVSFLINIRKRNCCWTEISLYFRVGKSSSIIRFLKNKPINRRSCWCNTRTWRNYISELINGVCKVSCIWFSCNKSSWCCSTQSCCTKRNNSAVKVIVSKCCTYINIPLTLISIILNWMSNITRIFIRNSRNNRESSTSIVDS